MLTMAEKVGKGGLDPPILADIICEQPLNQTDACLHKKGGWHNTAPNLFAKTRYMYAVSYEACIRSFCVELSV